MPRTNVFMVELFVDVDPGMPVPLVEIYGNVLLCTPELSLETSVHGLLQSSMHIIQKSSLIVLTHVCVSMHRLLQALVHMPPQASMLAMAAPRLCLLFYPKIFTLC